jgi:hydrogenase maturation factor HypE
VVRALIGIGEAGLAARIVGDRPVHVRRTRLAVTSSNAMLAEARDQFDTAVERFGEAAEGWDGWGGRFEHAHALAGLARSLEALGRGDEGADPATRARSIFESLGVATANTMLG